jgi:hypothetical protein
MADDDTPPLPTNIPMNCPRCGAPLLFVRANGNVAIYLCATDGMVLLPPNGRIRVVVH